MLVPHSILWVYLYLRQGEHSEHWRRLRDWSYCPSVRRSVMITHNSNDSLQQQLLSRLLLFPPLPLPRSGSSSSLPFSCCWPRCSCSSSSSNTYFTWRRYALSQAPSSCHCFCTNFIIAYSLFLCLLPLNCMFSIFLSFVLFYLRLLYFAVLFILLFTSCVCFVICVCFFIVCTVLLPPWQNKVFRRLFSLVAGAPAGKRIIIFVDDLNMPKLDTYGSQPPIELLRQYQDFGGLYDREKLFWKEINVSFTFLASTLFRQTVPNGRAVVMVVVRLSVFL